MVLNGSFVFGGVLGEIVKSAFVGHWWQYIVASLVPFVARILWQSARTVVEVTDGEQSLWVQLWLSQKPDAVNRFHKLMLVSPSAKMGRMGGYDEGRRARKVKEADEKEEEDGDRFAPPKLEFQPAHGIPFWTCFGWWPVSVASLVSSSADQWGRRNMTVGYTLTVWFAPYGATVVRDILLEGRQLWLEKRARKTEVWLYGRSGPLFKVISRPSRPLSTVIVADGIKEEIKADAIRFLGAEKWYVSKGIPYRRGFLLHGPPGCGKTSLVTALAGELRLPILFVALNSQEMDDAMLMEVLSEAPRDCIVLIEDIDCALSDRTPEPKKDQEAMRRGPYGRMPITLSGLLNALDGVGAQEGRLLFMTTNHLSKLDEALIRPGRVDAQFHLGKASRVAAGELFDQFFASSACSATVSKTVLDETKSAFLEKVEDGAHSFAALQGVLMMAHDDPDLVVDAMQNLLDSVVTLVEGKADADGSNENSRDSWETGGIKNGLGSMQSIDASGVLRTMAKEKIDLSKTVVEPKEESAVLTRRPTGASAKRKWMKSLTRGRSKVGTGGRAAETESAFCCS